MFKFSKLRKKYLIDILILSFIILTTISLIITTNESRVFILIIRNLATIIIVFGIFLILISGKINQVQIISIILTIFMITEGMLLSIINGSFNLSVPFIMVDGVVLLIGGFLFSLSQESIFSKNMVRNIIIYAFFGFLSILLSKGIIISYPPRFKFDYSSNISGINEVYSLGMSQFYGIAAILAAFYYVSENLKTKFISYLVIFSMLLLSFLGGGRGDSIFSLFIVFIILIKNENKYLLVSIMLIVVCIYFYMDDWSFLGDFTLYQRLTTDTETFGYRDVLLDKAFTLLSHDTKCLIFGCGFGYFQFYFNHEYGLYPHNFIAESIIVFGFPITISIFLLSSYGIKIYLKKNTHSDAFIYLYIYLFLVSLKSNSLTGNWLFISLNIYLISLAISFIALNKNKI